MGCQSSKREPGAPAAAVEDRMAGHAQLDRLPSLLSAATPDGKVLVKDATPSRAIKEREAATRIQAHIRGSAARQSLRQARPNKDRGTTPAPPRERRTVVVAESPEVHIHEHDEADAVFSRTSKRKATPFLGKASGPVKLGLGDVSEEDEDDEETTPTPPSDRRKVVIAESPEVHTHEHEQANAVFSRTGKRKATPFLGKASGAVKLDLVNDSEEEDDEDGVIAQAPARDRRKVVVAESPEVHTHEHEQADVVFSRTSKRKATPFLGKASGAVELDLDDVSEEDEDGGIALAPARERRKVVVAESPEVHTREQEQADVVFSRTSKRKATPFLGKASGAIELDLDDVSEEDEEDHNDASASSQRKGKQALPWDTTQSSQSLTHENGHASLVASVPVPGSTLGWPWASCCGQGLQEADEPLIIVDAPERRSGPDDAELSVDDPAHSKEQRRVVVVEPLVGSARKTAEDDTAGAAFSRTSKRKATPFIGKASGAGKINFADVSEDESDDAEERTVDVPGITIGYHKIRGLGAPLRMMAQYQQMEHTIVSYGEDMQDKWFNGKKPEIASKNACANLPYIVDGGENITQSITCLLYLGQKLGTDSPATNLHLFTRNHTVLNQVQDLRNSLMKVVYPSAGNCMSKDDFYGGAAKSHLEKSAKDHMSKLDAFLIQQDNSGPYFCGDMPQSGDFACWEMLDQHQSIAKDIGLSDDFLADNEFSNLRKLWVALKGEKTLQKYFDSELYTKYFHNNGLFTLYSGQPEGAVYGPGEEFSVR